MNEIDWSWPDVPLPLIESGSLSVHDEAVSARLAAARHLHVNALKLGFMNCIMCKIGLCGKNTNKSYNDQNCVVICLPETFLQWELL